MQAHKREIWADVAKGLAIVFVVYGHAYRGLREANLLSDSPAWAIVDYVIYTTHMPVFFFITGYFFDASIRKGGRKFWSGRLAVLVWPYLLWSFLQFQAQLLGDALKLTNGSPDPYRILTILWDPISPFWFLYALIAALLVSTLLRGMNALVPALVSAAVLLLSSLSSSMGVVNDIAYALFYVSCGRLWHLFEQPMSARLPLFQAFGVPLFAATAALGFVLGIPDRLNVPAAFAGLLVVMTVSNAIARGSLGTRLFATLGSYSMGIYVMHITVLGAARALGMQLFGGSIPLTLMLEMVLGVALPMLVQKAANDLHVAGYLGLKMPRPNWRFGSLA